MTAAGRNQVQTIFKAGKRVLTCLWRARSLEARRRLGIHYLGGDRTAQKA